MESQHSPQQSSSRSSTHPTNGATEFVRTERDAMPNPSSKVLEEFLKSLGQRVHQPEFAEILDGNRQNVRDAEINRIFDHLRRVADEESSTADDLFENL